MGYSRFFGKKTKVVAVVKPKKTIQKKKGLGKKAVLAIVKTQLSKNIENKRTYTYNTQNPVAQVQYLASYWLLVNNWHNLIFGMNQGVGEQQRLGNQIRLKRWVIKGMISPSIGGVQYDENAYLFYSQQGYLTLYFGKQKDGVAMTSSLTGLFDSGNGQVDPNGSQLQSMYPLNTDRYKIYWKKRFKLSPSYGANATTRLSPNNDFDCVRTFGFDVCKYILKNAVLKYNDTSTAPYNQTLHDLGFFATWTPAIGDMASPFPQGSALMPHFYRVNLTSYAEYEDA